MALTISQLVNDYGSYSGNTLIGEFGARANVPNPGFSGVTGVPYPNITFIVRVNGSDYASSSWLAEQRNGNPYIHKTSVPRINVQSVNGVNKDTLGPKLPGATNDFPRDEGYAEVKATSNIESTDEVLSFINYLLDGRETVDPAIPTFGSFSPAIWSKSPTNPSVPQQVTNPATDESYDSGVKVGNKGGKSWPGVYSPEDDMRGNYPGMAFKATGFDGFVFGREAAQQSLPKVIGEEIVDPEISEAVDKVLEDFELQPLDLGPYFTYEKFADGFDFGLDNLNPITNNNVFGDTGNNNVGLASFNALSNEGGLSQVGLGSYNTDYSGQPLGLLSDSLSSLSNFGGFG
tara:strand:+ start:110 stop:1147 length:1038 start_codon:yes stop_codon:yes gene_type:complete